MKRLVFTMKRHWFNEIKCGNKTVEYRTIKPYWTSRIKNALGGVLPTETTPVCPEGLVAVFSDDMFFRDVVKRRVTMIDIGECPYPKWDGKFYRIHFEGKKVKE